MALNHASKLLLLLLSLGSVATQAIAANLLAGPMQGATAMRSAVIWLQAESGKKVLKLCIGTKMHLKKCGKHRLLI